MVAGGGAGMMEALACHPLGTCVLPPRIDLPHANRPPDTVKVNMQLSPSSRNTKASASKKDMSFKPKDMQSTTTQAFLYVKLLFPEDEELILQNRERITVF